MLERYLPRKQKKRPVQPPWQTDRLLLNSTRSSSRRWEVIFYRTEKFASFSWAARHLCRIIAGKVLFPSPNRHR